MGEQTSLTIPSDKVALISSEECGAWAVEHCRRGVVGHVDSAGRYVLTFGDAGEAEAFRVRWLAGEDAGKRG